MFGRPLEPNRRKRKEETVRPRLNARRAAEIARGVARRLPSRPWRRILHVSDHHNLPSGFRLANALTESIAPDVVVNTGDVSGWGPVAERAILWRYLRFTRPYVFAPGNHDSTRLSERIKQRGGSVFEAPHSEDVCGIPFWGFRDPNRTHLFGKQYRPELCLQAAEANRPPDQVRLVAVVHNELMESSASSLSLVLSGHFHSSRLSTKDGVLFVRSGSIGGAGPLRKLPLQFAIIDLGSGVIPEAVFFGEVSGGKASIERAAL